MLNVKHREEGEKFNVYKAYLNMESVYGSPESTTALLDRAVKNNDPFKVLMEMVNIYIRVDKLDVSFLSLSCLYDCSLSDLY